MLLTMGVWRVGGLAEGCAERGGWRDGFINIKDMHNNDGGQRGAHRARVCEAHEAK